jgi:hypothetical protein
MVPRITWAVCFLASAITLVLGYTSTAGPGSGDVYIIAFVLGPYLLLGLLAWWQRGKSIASWLLLAVTVSLATWGVCLFGLDSYWHHTDWQYRIGHADGGAFCAALAMRCHAGGGIGLALCWAIGM